MVDVQMAFSTEMDSKELDVLKREKFDYRKLDTLFAEITTDLSDVNPELFWKILLEVVKIFNEMSSALSLAFQDITSKVAIMKKNYATSGNPKVGLLSFISREIELNIHFLNSHNNKKLKAIPQYAKYESTARSLLRMSWFMDFLSVLFTGLGKDTKASPSECARAAYTAALGPHHPFMLRQVAKIAMSAAPGRKTFEKKLFPDLSSEKVCETANKWAERINQVRGVVGKFYTDNKLTELP